jgi:hypothetical protein
MYNIDWNDKAWAADVINTDPMAIIYAPDFVKNNRDIVLIAVSGDGEALSYVNTQFKNDLKIIQTALQSNGMAYLCLSDVLQRDYEIIKLAIIQNPKVASFVPDDVIADPIILALFEEYNADPNEFELDFLQNELRFDAFVDDMKSLQDNTEEREHDLEMLPDTIEWAWEH